MQCVLGGWAGMRYEGDLRCCCREMCDMLASSTQITYPDEKIQVLIMPGGLSAGFLVVSLLMNE